MSSESGRIWFGLEYRLHTVREMEWEAGRTGKGVLHFWEVDAHTGGVGKYRAVDIEDVISISTTSQVNVPKGSKTKNSKT